MYQCVPRINQSFTSDFRDVKSNGGDWDFGVLSPPPIFVGGINGSFEDC